MSLFLFHPPECEKIVDPLLGKKTLRFVEPCLEGEGFDREGNIRCERQDLARQTLSSVMVTSSCNIVFIFLSYHTTFQM